MPSRPPQHPSRAFPGTWVAPPPPPPTPPTPPTPLSSTVLVPASCPDCLIRYQNMRNAQCLAATARRDATAAAARLHRHMEATLAAVAAQLHAEKDDALAVQAATLNRRREDELAALLARLQAEKEDELREQAARLEQQKEEERTSREAEMRLDKESALKIQSKILGRKAAEELAALRAQLSIETERALLDQAARLEQQKEEQFTSLVKEMRLEKHSALEAQAEMLNKKAAEELTALQSRHMMEKAQLQVKKEEEFAALETRLTVKRERELAAEAKARVQDEAMPQVVKFEQATSETRQDAHATQVEELQTQLQTAQQQVEALKGDLAQLQDHLDGVMCAVRHYRECYLNLRGTVRTMVRIRGPASPTAQRCYRIGRWPDTTEPKLTVLRTERGAAGKTSTATRDFRVDDVFGPGASVADIFKEVYPLVENAIDGADVLVVAYGRSGTGKTTTINGLLDEVVGLLCRDGDSSHGLALSCTQLYLDRLSDLLCSDPDSQVLDATKTGKLFVPSTLGARAAPITSTDNLRHFLSQAQQRRITSPTSLNATSSRSTAITTIFLPPSDTTGGDSGGSGGLSGGTVTLVDLPGHESSQAGGRQSEATSINSSLAALNAVFRTLGEMTRGKAGGGGKRSVESVFGQSQDMLPRIIGGLMVQGPCGSGGKQRSRLKTKVVLLGTVDLADEAALGGSIETLASLQEAAGIKHGSW